MIESGHTGYVVENFRIINTPGQPEKRERYVERYSASPTKIARGTGGAPTTTPTAPATTPTTPAAAPPADARESASARRAGRRLTPR